MEDAETLRLEAHLSADRVQERMRVRQVPHFIDDFLEDGGECDDRVYSTPNK